MTTCRPVIYGREYVISSGHSLASFAGAEILRAGGNAIDAGVAAGMALSVLESELVGFAGVAPIILYVAEIDRVVTISGLGAWPVATDQTLFETKYGGKIPEGILRTVVPSAPDAWITALQQFGTMSFAEVSSFAIEFAKKGFHMYPLMSELIEKNHSNYNRYPGNKEIYLPDGKAPAVGSLFVQRDLGDTIAYMAEEEVVAAKRGTRDAGLRAARNAFYKGDIAATIVKYHRDEGGFLSARDLADFSVDVEDPLSIIFNEADVYSCGAWCQGPMLLQALNILKGFDLSALGHNSPEYLHVVAEAIKLAAADRERYLGDPKFTDVPVELLLSDAFAETRRSKIDLKRATPDLPEAGSISDLLTRGFNGPDPDATMDTSYVCVVDKEGSAFSATPSDASNKSPVIPGLGMVISPRGQQSWVDPNHPSSIVPGKRPRLTPNPALCITRDRIIPFGSPGGDVQTQAMLQALINHLVFGFDVQESVELPRIASYSFPSSFEPHQNEPGVLRAEGRLPDETVEALRSLGHKVEVWPDFCWLAGSVSMINADKGSGTRRGAADPRRAGYAAGW